MDNNTYKKCYYTCKECELGGDNITHNCTICNDNYPFSIRYNNYINCYNNENYYLDKLNNEQKYSYYLNNININNNAHKLINNENITQKLIITSHNIEVIYECKKEDSLNNNCNFININNNTDIFNIIKENIQLIYDGKSQIIKGEDDIIFQVTNGKNELELLQDNFINKNNISIVDLGQCESKLKEEYNFNDNISLIYIKQEKINVKASEKKISYEIYEPYNFTKLNISICDKEIINIYVKLNLSEEIQLIYDNMKSKGYDMFNINDPFYQDICTPFKSSNNTDILLSDRIDYIYYNKDSQCQSNCDFSSYVMNSLYMNCSCSVTEEKPKEVNKFNGKKIYESFWDVLKYSNIKIFKCYNLIFTKNIFKNNLGNVIILIIFLFYSICFLFFIIRGIAPLKNILTNIFSKLEEKYLSKGKIILNAKL